jgi:hypothetical protein
MTAINVENRQPLAGSTIVLLTSPRPVKPSPACPDETKANRPVSKRRRVTRTYPYRDQPKPVRKDNQSRNAAYVSLSSNNNVKQRNQQTRPDQQGPNPATPTQGHAQKQNPPTENPPTQYLGQPTPHQKMGKLRKLSATLQRRRR